MNTVLTIARLEMANGLRNRWVAATVLLLAALSLALTFLGSAPTGTTGADRLAVTVVSLVSLTVYLVPLIALLLSFDAIVGEAERGTLLLLLAHPVERGQVLIGKFFGHLAILALATIIGYGAAGLVAWTMGDDGSWPPFVTLLATSVFLGGVFLALGYLASAVVRERPTAAGLALGIWLVFVVVFDLAVLGLLVSAGEAVLSETAFRILLLFNPADVFRMINLLGFESIRTVAGLASVDATRTLGVALLFSVLLLWIAVPLGAAWLVFRTREV